MTKISSLDNLYTQEYDRVYLELETYTTDILNKKGKKLFVKRAKISSDLNDKLNYLTAAKVTDMNSIPDPYTEALIYGYHQYMNENEDEKISGFIIEELDLIKDKYKNHNLSIPENIMLNAEQTVQLIAKWKATELFIKRFNSISSDDNIELYTKKISREGYTAPPPTVNIEKPEGKKSGKVFTEKRQVLTIYYMLKALGINKFNTKADIGRIIHLITGEDIPVVEGKEILDNSIIYKRLKTLLNPKRGERNHEDLKFIKSLFENLKNSGTKGIQEIIQTINKDLTK